MTQVSARQSGGRIGRAIGVTMIVFALIAVGAWLQSVRERVYPASIPPESELYVTSGSAVSNLTKGYNALAADLYWIRAIQYYGDLKLRTKHEATEGNADFSYPRLYPLLDITTTLDPRFKIAYQFGAIFLAEAQPGGAGRPDQAVALLEKGLRAEPDKWEYMRDIGFIHYWWHHDYKTAAEWFQRAADAPGGPWFLRSLAATTLAEGGDRQSSRTMWQSIRESADNDWLRNEADRRLKQLDAFDAIGQLQRRIDLVTTRLGHVPANWNEVVAAGALPGVPLDPARVPFVIASGHVDVAPSSPLYPLPEEPKHLGEPRR